MGAPRDGVWAAVVAVEQAVERVHGGGTHDVAVLENAAHAGGIVEDIETRVAEVARDAELQRSSGGEDIVATADHRVGPVRAKPRADRGRGIRTGDDEGRDGGGGGPGATLFKGVGGFPLVGDALGEVRFDDEADAGVATLTQSYPREPYVGGVVGQHVVEVRVAHRALDGDSREARPIEIEAAVGLFEWREDEAANSPGREHAAEAGRRHGVLAGPEMLQIVAVGAGAGRGAGEQALGTRAVQPVVARRPMGDQSDDGKIAAHAQLLPVGGERAAGGVGCVVEFQGGPFYPGDRGGGQRGVIPQRHRHGGDAEAEVLGDVFEGRRGRRGHLSDSVEAALFRTARTATR